MKELTVFKNNLPSVMVDIQQVDEVLKRYPELSFDSKKNIIKGELNCKDLDSYNVEINIAPFFIFTKRFPSVIEDGRIPKKADRHVYPQNGNLCFTTPTIEKTLLYTKEVTTLLEFVDEILVPYLLNNSYYEETGEYKFGEYSHNIIDATFESYFDLLGLENDFKSKRLVVLLFFNKLEKNNITPNDKCFCGSGKKIKKCQNHLDVYRLFRGIGSEITNMGLPLVLKEAYNHMMINGFFSSVAKEMKKFGNMIENNNKLSGGNI